MIGRRSSDKQGWQAVSCWLALRASETWEWVDKRAIDKHAVSLVILWGTYRITEWGMAYAESHPAGSDAALVIAAVVAPYMALQAAAISSYFNTRK